MPISEVIELLQAWGEILDMKDMKDLFGVDHLCNCIDGAWANPRLHYLLMGPDRPSFGVIDDLASLGNEDAKDVWVYRYLDR